MDDDDIEWEGHAYSRALGSALERWLEPAVADDRARSIGQVLPYLPADEWGTVFRAMLCRFHCYGRMWGIAPEQLDAAAADCLDAVARVESK